MAVAAQRVDVAVIGAGAAGLACATWAGRTAPGARVVVLDGAKKLGAKILVSGGGRCNVTHDVVDETAFAGSTRPAIRKVLRRFDVPEVIAFFREAGVHLTREDTGKLFPVTNSARTVLDALLRVTREAGAEVRHPCRVESVRRVDDGFHVEGEWGALTAARVVLATGGRSLPKSGSDGHGYEIVRALGHSVTPRVLPALVPLRLAEGSWLRALPGVALPATLEVRSATGRRTAAFTGPVLCTHFGVSGPCVMDVSRYFLDALADDPRSRLVANWLPGETSATLDAVMRTLGGRTPAAFLATLVPARFARALCEEAGVAPSLAGAQVPRELRRALVSLVTEMALPVTGDRGFDHAEVTAGGVPLRELHLDTLESRRCPGLHLCGEICDVDGRIGGYNFQWAWASGFVAGVAAGAADGHLRCRRVGPTPHVPKRTLRRRPS